MGAIYPVARGRSPPPCLIRVWSTCFEDMSSVEHAFLSWHYVSKHGKYGKLNREKKIMFCYVVTENSTMEPQCLRQITWFALMTSSWCHTWCHGWCWRSAFEMCWDAFEFRRAFDLIWDALKKLRCSFEERWGDSRHTQMFARWDWLLPNTKVRYSTRNSAFEGAYGAKWLGTRTRCPEGTVADILIYYRIV